MITFTLAFLTSLLPGRVRAPSLLPKARSARVHLNPWSLQSRVQRSQLRSPKRLGRSGTIMIVVDAISVAILDKTTRILRMKVGTSLLLLMVIMISLFRGIIRKWKARVLTFAHVIHFTRKLIGTLIKRAGWFMTYFCLLPFGNVRNTQLEYAKVPLRNLTYRNRPRNTTRTASRIGRSPRVRTFMNRKTLLSIGPRMRIWIPRHLL